MAFYGPERYVDMVDLAHARSIDPAKFVKGLGQEQMAMATPCEDTVTMAATAGRRALAAFDVDPAEIGMLIIGTETGVDHSKPAAVYVHELLRLPERCRTFETKHACYGAMAGLTAATDWIAAGRARGRKALIIASDIARYGIQTPGEPTQGAGAVAMVVSASPRLIAFDEELYGDYTRQVMDFWRPLYSKYAYVDGHYSIACYLDALSGALADARDAASVETDISLEHLDACLYHVPFVKMARKAHTRHWEFELRQPIDEQNPTGQERSMASYQQMVAPWLSLNSVVGNIYTGSLFLSLIDYLRGLTPEREGRRLSLFSYGSGCGAAFCVGHVSDGASRYRQAIDPQHHIDGRRKLSIDEYERLLHACEHVDESDIDDVELSQPSAWDLRGEIFYMGTRQHIRQYSDRSL